MPWCKQIDFLYVGIYVCMYAHTRSKAELKLIRITSTYNTYSISLLLFKTVQLCSGYEEEKEKLSWRIILKHLHYITLKLIFKMFKNIQPPSVLLLLIMLVSWKYTWNILTCQTNNVAEKLWIYCSVLTILVTLKPYYYSDYFGFLAKEDM